MYIYLFKPLKNFIANRGFIHDIVHVGCCLKGQKNYGGQSTTTFLCVLIKNLRMFNYYLELLSLFCAVKMDKKMRKERQRIKEAERMVSAQDQLSQ